MAKLLTLLWSAAVAFDDAQLAAWKPLIDDDL
jgi:hypothetical protein